MIVDRDMFDFQEAPGVLDLLGRWSGMAMVADSSCEVVPIPNTNNYWGKDGNIIYSKNLDILLLRGTLPDDPLNSFMGIPVQYALPGENRAIYYKAKSGSLGTIVVNGKTRLTAEVVPWLDVDSLVRGWSLSKKVLDNASSNGLGYKLRPAISRSSFSGLASELRRKCGFRANEEYYDVTQVEEKILVLTNSMEGNLNEGFGVVCDYWPNGSGLGIFSVDCEGRVDYQILLDKQCDSSFCWYLHETRKA